MSHVTVVRLPLVGSDSVGQVMATIGPVDPDLAEHLHTPNVTRSYACLRRNPWLEVVAFDDRVARALLAGTLSACIAHRVPLATVTGTDETGFDAVLTFTRPVHLRAAKRDYLFPAPERIMADLTRKWCDLGLPELGYLNADRIGGEILDYGITTHPANRGARWRGFTGRVRLDLGHVEAPQRARVWRLLRFGAYRGVGAHTTYGMGRYVIGTPQGRVSVWDDPPPSAHPGR